MTPLGRLLFAALLFIAVLTGLPLWHVYSSVPQGQEDGSRRASLRVGFATEVPYAYLDAQGQVTGEAPEIFVRMARQLGVQQIDWVRMDFASLLPELQLGRIDAIAAGMFVTPERQQLAAFTRPTATVRPALVVRTGEQRISSRPLLSSLKQGAGLRWVTVHDAAENDMLIQAGVSADHIRTVTEVGRGLRAVAAGQADALAISAVTAWQWVANHPEWSLEVRTLADAPAGFPAFVFRNNDQSLRDAFDHSLQSYLGTEEHIELVRRFGFTSEERPPDQP